jgi:hypothetical protein
LENAKQDDGAGTPRGIKCVKEVSSEYRLFGPSQHRRLGIFLAIAFSVPVIGPGSALSQSVSAEREGIQHYETNPTFRMGGVGVSFVFGVNQNGELREGTFHIEKSFRQTWSDY